MTFDQQGYDIYNLSSDFYNDKCSGANINGNDIIINDRRKDIYPYNVSFCPNNCGLKNTEIKNQRFNCSCNISFIRESLPSSQKEILELNIQTNENYFVYLLDMLNYKIFGCAKVLSNTSVNDIFNNIGFYLGVLIILFSSFNCFFFFLCFLSKIRIEMYKLIPDDLRLFSKASKLKNQIKNLNKYNSAISNPKRKEKIKKQ